MPDGPRADHRDVKAQVLVRLAHLDHHRPVLGDLTAAQDGPVGAFHGLDGDDGLVLHHHRLTDIDAAHRLGDLAAEGDVVQLGQCRGPPRQRTLGGQVFLDQKRGVNELNAVLLHFLGNGRKNGVGLAVLNGIKNLPQPVVLAHLLAEEIVGIDLTGHDRLVHFLVAEIGAQLFELADVKGAQLVDEGFEQKRGVALDPGRDDFIIHRAGLAGEENGELAVTGYQT